VGGSGGAASLRTRGSTRPRRALGFDAFEVGWTGLEAEARGHRRRGAASRLRCTSVFFFFGAGECLDLGCLPIRLFLFRGGDVGSMCFRF
jgi:hypothetical protein